MTRPNVRRTALHDLDAFCSTCPPPEDVTAALQGFGFVLTFHMPTVVPPAYTQVPPLPAQYHYQDRSGSEIIYLAGRDANSDGIRLPPHASRFWAFPGADVEVFQWVTQALAARWAITWQSSPDLAGQAVA